ncbi:MAG TPA: M13 family metallopeptidase, partial [Steroidobacteraceae bacterium]|nr:M13 family metallopeptidase [Steroidobacteraceae bacterium]
MNTMRQLLAGLALLAACASAAATDQPVTVPAGGQAGPSGVMLGNFDREMRPQDDFYRYVNGGWLARTEIPADKSNFGMFQVLQDSVEQNLKVIVESAAAANSPVEGTHEQLIGDFYASFMDERRAERAGAAPLQGPLREIDAISDRAGLVEYFGRTQRHFVSAPPGVADFGVAAPLRVAVSPDAKQPDRYAAYLTQFGLGLPDRDYYLGDEPRYVEIRSQYQAYLADLLSMAGRDGAAGSAAAVIELETRLARAQWSQVELRDVEKSYNPYQLAEAARLMPGFDWQAWLAAAGLPALERLIISQPSYFEALAAALAEVPLETWKDYLRVRRIDDYAPLLSRAFVERHFGFNAGVLTGAAELPPRWKRALQQVEFVMGDVLGRAYVERHFPPEAKRRMDELVANLLRAFGSSIDELDWMGKDTRDEAHRKLAAIAVKIGYPDRWKEYPGLAVRRDDLVGNVFRAREANYRREIAKLGRPVDRDEWLMTPQTVNAYYNPLANEIVFPAAILQPPFFNLRADDAVNYGGIGAVIGHETSHGFDDQGRKFDDAGALRDWWTPEDDRRFQARAEELVKQYSAFSPLPGLNVNGELTLGENIGDLSGLTVAHKAYRISLAGESAPELDDLSGDQRFFIGWAQIWARKYRE